MAVTGLILVAYLITHVLANLLVLQWSRPDQRATPRCSTAPAARSGRARLVLLAALILHIVAATQLAIRQPRGPAGRLRGRARAAGLDLGVAHDPLGRGADPGCS